MPIGPTEKQNNSDALRKREEKRMDAKRKEINDQIKEWEAKLKNIYDQIPALALEQSNLDTYLEEWATQKQQFSKKEIADVVIVNVFEGVCAEKIKSDLETCFLQMDQTCDKVRGLKDNIGRQISKLNQYKLYINGMLEKLNSDLKSI